MAKAGRREVLDLPALPKGLATNLGQLMIGGLAVVAAVFAFVDSKEYTVQTAVALGGSIITAVTVMVGRYAQSCALLKQVPSPVAATSSGIAVASPGTQGPATAVAPPTVVVHCCHCSGQD